MRQYFLYTLALAVPLALLGWFLYTLGRTLVSLYQDWRLGKELDELQAGVAARRQQRLIENEQRLNTGCQHDFETPVSGLPPTACRKCGMEKEKPTAGCDHVWKVRKGAIPSSACEKCGRTFSVADDRGRQS